MSSEICKECLAFEVKKISEQKQITETRSKKDGKLGCCSTGFKIVLPLLQDQSYTDDNMNGS